MLEDVTLIDTDS